VKDVIWRCISALSSLWAVSDISRLQTERGFALGDIVTYLLDEVVALSLPTKITSPLIDEMSNIEYVSSIIARSLLFCELYVLLSCAAFVCVSRHSSFVVIAHEI